MAAGRVDTDGSDLVPIVPPPNTRQRWLARTALLATLAAFVVLLVGAGQRSGVLLAILLGMVGARMGPGGSSAGAGLPGR
jgi:hypothetical protein